MATLSYLPSKRDPNDLTPVNQAMLYAQRLLTKGIPKGKAEEKERYDYFTKRAYEAPFLTVDETKSDSRNWSEAGIKVSDILLKFLPKAVVASVTKDFDDLQSIMDDSGAGMNDFTTFFYNKKHQERTILEFAILRLPAWDVSYFEVYYLKIAASFNGERILFVEVNKNELNCEYQYAKFSALTDTLIEYMKENEEQAKKDIDDWLKRCKKA